MEAYMKIANDYQIRMSGLLPDREPILPITEDQLRRLEIITRFIEDNFRQGRGKKSSYGLKHLVERELGSQVQSYVSNGELMLCMLHCGYKVKDRHGPNLYFGVDTDYQYKDGYKTGKDVFWKYGKYLHENRQMDMEWTDEDFKSKGYNDLPHLWRKGYDQAKQDCEKKYIRCGYCFGNGVEPEPHLCRQNRKSLCS